MTRSEFYAKYGSVKVKFCEYYKFTFTYEADLPDGNRLACGYGGNAEEIYRFNCGADDETTVDDLQPYTGAVYSMGSGNEIEGFYDY